ncbi:MAG: DUF4368 domain-containing protein [Aminipila sp.]
MGILFPSPEDIGNLINLIKKYTDIQELNTKILNRIKERIVFYKKTENTDGSKT